MARRFKESTAQKDRRERNQMPAADFSKGKHPHAVSKAKAHKPVRRSPRLHPECIEHTKCEHPLPAKKTLFREDRLTAPQSTDRKRSRGVEDLVEDTAPVRKRPFAVKTQTTVEGASVCHSETSLDPINYWRRHQTWPKKYFEPDNKIRHLFAMQNLLAKKRSTPSLRSKQSASLTVSYATPSDQKPREEKSAPYQDVCYGVQLKMKGSHMGEYTGENEYGVLTESKNLCQTLLEKEQPIPENSLFDDEVFEHTWQKLKDKNEARVAKDLADLIVPSAEALAGRFPGHLNCVAESVNEGWNNCIPFLGPRPQPDYAVGFERTAFTENQLSKIQPTLGDIMDLSFFRATHYMYLPFLTCEVKCSAAGRDAADRQNAHSMTLAVRAIVELFRLVKRQQELHRQILAFSISHDNEIVRIYGHYPVIAGKNTTFYCHRIRAFNFTELEGKERWVAYQFTKNVYDLWVPQHLDRIRSVLDELPSDFDFEASILLEESDPAQDSGRQRRSGSFTELKPLPDERDSHLDTVDVRDVTEATSFPGQGAYKRPRRNAAKSKR